MISRLSNWVVTLLCKSGTISTDEQELYIYGFFLLFSRLVFLILTAVFGCMLGVLWESILFYIIFSTLREYAGGIHASKEWVCQISTTLLMLLCVAGIHFQEVKGCTAVSLLLLLLGSATVFLLSPLDSEEKPLAPSERRYYRKISRGMVTILGLAALGLALLHEFVFLYISTMTVLSEGGLLILGKVKMERSRREHTRVRADNICSDTDR